MQRASTTQPDRRPANGHQPGGALVEGLTGQPPLPHPLRQPVFRDLWLANLVSNVGTWMQSVGGAWLMLTLTSAALPVSLMQTATSLPVFLVGLPAGTIADRVDRRLLLIATQAWMLMCALALGVMTILGLITPVWLLGLTLALGFGNAISAPVFQAVIPDLVGREQMPTAIALNSVGFNSARAVGPALAGLVLAAFGAALNFLFNAASFLGVIGVLFRWHPAPVVRAAHSSEPSLLHGTVEGLRYSWQAPVQRIVLGRSLLWVVCASVLWALLPLVANKELGMDARGYGFLLGCTGAGAVCGALVLPWLRARWTTNQLLMLAIVLFGAMLMVLAWVKLVPVVGIMLALGGAAWTTSNANFQIAVQVSAPNWVRARAISTYVLSFQGSIAVGGALWGEVAGRLGDSVALTVAAAGVAISFLAALRWSVNETAAVD